MIKTSSPIFYKWALDCSIQNFQWVGHLVGDRINLVPVKDNWISPTTNFVMIVDEGHTNFLLASVVVLDLLSTPKVKIYQEEGYDQGLFCHT